jgi:hypothetical protein
LPRAWPASTPEPGAAAGLAALGAEAGEFALVVALREPSRSSVPVPVPVPSAMAKPPPATTATAASVPVAIHFLVAMIVSLRRAEPGCSPPSLMSPRLATRDGEREEGDVKESSSAMSAASSLGPDTLPS